LIGYADFDAFRYRSLKVELVLNTNKTMYPQLPCFCGKMWIHLFNEKHLIVCKDSQGKRYAIFTNGENA
jgi:hypothetical protein